jgi:hypothetical protein
MAGVSLNSPIVGMTSSADGGGYWLVGADGGIFSFGDAAFYGGLGGQTLNSPIVGITSSASGKGYWLVGADGGIFAFGDAPFDGSASGQFGSGVHAVGVAQTTSLTAGVVVKIPGAPTGAAAIGGNAAALVGWTAPVDTGGLSITGYAVTPLLNGVPQTTQTFTGSATAVIVNGLTGIGNYTFVVAAINGVGVGPQSGPSNAVTTVTVGAGKPASGSSGYDISNWQCSGYPPAAAIGIIEVTGYLGSSTAYNPCLSGEAAWAGSGLGYYVFMSGGSDGSIPGQCAGNASCAHGWNGAAAAYAHVANLGLNTHVVWWLDVESDPSWSSNTAANQSVVQGAVSYLQSQGVTVGIYTGNYSWNAIVGRWQPNLPLWVADYAGLSGATTCADEPAWAANAGAALPTGGLWMMQYTDTAAGSFDGDWAC